MKVADGTKLFLKTKEIGDKKITRRNWYICQMVWKNKLADVIQFWEM